VEDSWLTYDAVAPLVGAAFTARTDDGARVPLTLTEASDTGLPGGAAPDGQPRTQFSLVFRGPVELPLQQGTYSIGGDLLEPQPIFIVPIGADAEGRYYQAVFA
jgi:hypothetical protein